MHPKVVEEVVPLSEEHPAVLMIALQDLDLPHRLRVFVFEHPELFSLWNRFFDFNRVEIKILTILNVNGGIFWNLLVYF